MRLGEILVNAGLIDVATVRAALQRPQPGVRLGERLIASGHLSEDAMARAIAAQLRLPMVALDELAPTPETVAALPAPFARSRHAVVTKVGHRALHVATDDPLQPRLVDEIALASHCNVHVEVASAGAVRRALVRWYGGGAGQRAVVPLDVPRRELAVNGLKLTWPRLVALRRDRLVVVEGRDLVMAWTIDDPGVVPCGLWPTGWNVGAVALSSTRSYVLAHAAAGTWAEVREVGAARSLGSFAGPERVAAAFGVVEDEEVVVVSRRPDTVEVLRLPDLTTITTLTIPPERRFGVRAMTALEDGVTLALAGHGAAEVENRVAFVNLEAMCNTRDALDRAIGEAWLSSPWPTVGPAGWDGAVVLVGSADAPVARVVTAAGKLVGDVPLPGLRITGAPQLVATPGVIAVADAEEVWMAPRAGGPLRGPERAVAAGIDGEAGRIVALDGQRHVQVFTLPRD